MSYERDKCKQNLGATEECALDIRTSEAPVHHQASLFATVANILCTMIGGGLLSLPLAFAQAGLFPGLLLTAVCASTCLIAVYFIARSCESIGVFSFRGLVVHSFCHLPSRLLGALAEGIILFSNTGSLLIYAVVITDSMPGMAAHYWGVAGPWTEKYFWLLTCGAFFLLLSPIRRLHEIVAIAVFGFLAMIYISVVLFVRCGKNLTVLPENSTHWGVASTSLLTSFSLINGAYMFHMNVPPLYGELYNASPRRMLLAGGISLVIAFLLYASVGICGYYLFGTPELLSLSSGGNFLNSLPAEAIDVNLARLMIVFHIVCAFPIYAFVARRALHIIFTGQDEEENFLRRAITGGSLVLLTMGVALFIPDLALLLSFTGAVFGCTFGMILPSVIYYRIHGGAWRQHRERNISVGDSNVVQSSSHVPSTHLMKLAPVLAILGFIAMITSVVVMARDRALKDTL